MYEVELDRAADEMIDDGTIKPLIIVCPSIENSKGMNTLALCREILNPGDSNRKIHLGMYEDYLIKDVVSTIDSTYSTINNRNGRYIAG